MVTIVRKKKKKIRTNPNGANQYDFDIRQDHCWEFYIDPTSTTYGNAYQSAMKAQYTKGSSIKITSQPWFSEKRRRLGLLSKAEKVLEDTVTIETNLPVIGQFGPIMIPTGEYDEKGKEIKKLLYGQNDRLLKIKQDTAKFIAQTQGKQKGYSTRSELTGKDGKELLQPIINIIQYGEPIKEE